MLIDKERDVMAATERLRSRLAESYEKQDKLVDDASNLQVCFYIFPMHSYKSNSIYFLIKLYTYCLYGVLTATVT